MNGFGFIEYKDAMDARDVVPGKLLFSNHQCASELMANAVFMQPSVCTIALVLLPFLLETPDRTPNNAYL